MDIGQIRKIFKVTDKFIFFNNAAESPMNSIYRDKLDEFYDLATFAPHTKPDVRQVVREKLSQLLGGQSEDYALITSTGIGSGIVAGGLSFKKGDNIVLPKDEHRNNLFPWLALQEKGLEIRFVAVAKNGYIAPEDIEACVDENTKLVTIAAVRFNSGYRADLKRISEIAHSKNALLCVDAIQAAGIVPIDVEKMGIDIMSSAGFKWLLGIPGTGFLYVSEHARKLIKPIIPGMFAAENSTSELKYYEDSRKYETGSISYSLFYAWQASLDFLSHIGIDNIFKRVLTITDLIINGFQERNIEILSPLDYKNRSSILFFTLGSEENNLKLVKRLESQNIIMCVRDGKCRISPSFYSTESEVSTFFKVLDALLLEV